MIELLIATVEEEPSKTLYYLAGAVLVAFAIAISVFGFTRPNFPSTPRQERLVMTLSVAFTAFVVVAVLVTG